MSFQENETEVQAERIIKAHPACYLCTIGTLLVLGAIVAIMLWMLTSCTVNLSFENISTHGTATDLVDENQKNVQDISPKTALSIPLKPL